MQSRTDRRQTLQISPAEKLVLVTPGGGEDGYEIINQYLAAIKLLPANHNVRSLIISGPEMPATQREKFLQASANDPRVTVLEFTDDLMSFMAAADVVVAMAGYNTISEILTLQKNAIVIPRAHPTQEQIIRAQRMAAQGFFTNLHPSECTPQNLLQALQQELTRTSLPPHLALDGLPALAAQSECNAARKKEQCRTRG